MIIRFTLLGCATFFFGASPAYAQGRTPQKATAPDSVMKSMIVKNPKNKSTLAARFGMTRRTVTTPAQPSAPTSVREIKAPPAK